MPPYSIFMLIFAAAILVYAGILAATKDYRMLPLKVQVSIKKKNRKEYCYKLSKVIALTAAAPAACGIVSIWSGIGAMIAFVAVLVICLRAGIKMMEE